MLTGRVTSDKEAVLPIEVLGANGRAYGIEAGIIDTGFNGFLTLPKRVIEDLDLTFVRMPVSRGGPSRVRRD